MQNLKSLGFMAVRVQVPHLTSVDGNIIIAQIDGKFRMWRYKMHPVRGLERLNLPGKLEQLADEVGVVCLDVLAQT